ncbi:hypothetical protein GQ42DRAFT_158739 [Ramicandelaber brevisporus]|nr:hypothetical protein GQ42DRAFT_158739 [Ramicandelaber brevisporus]
MKFSLVSAAAAAAFLVTLTAAEVVVWDGHGFQGDHVNCAWGCGDGQICPFDYRLDGRQRSIRSVDAMDYNLFLELMTEEERRAHKARTEQQLASSGSGSGSIGSGTFDSKVPKILPQAAASTGVEHTDRHGPIHARRVSLTKWPSNPSAVDGSDNPAIAGGSSASTTAGVSTVTGSVHSGGGSGSSSGETLALEELVREADVRNHQHWLGARVVFGVRQCAHIRVTVTVVDLELDVYAQHRVCVTKH